MEKNPTEKGKRLTVGEYLRRDNETMRVLADRLPELGVAETCRVLIGLGRLPASVTSQGFAGAIRGMRADVSIGDRKVSLEGVAAVMAIAYPGRINEEYLAELVELPERVNNAGARVGARRGTFTKRERAAAKTDSDPRMLSGEDIHAVDMLITSVIEFANGTGDGFVTVPVPGSPGRDDESVTVRREGHKVFIVLKSSSYAGSHMMCEIRSALQRRVGLYFRGGKESRLVGSLTSKSVVISSVVKTPDGDKTRILQHFGKER